MSNRVTVIIPCYNYSEFLADAIESVLNQNKPADLSIECIVVDDGSTDSTAQIAKKYASRGVKYFYQVNSGPAAARNLGIKSTQSDYMCFLDADDKLYLNFVTSCLALLGKQAANVGYVYTGLKYIGEKSGQVAGNKYDIDHLKYENYIHASAMFKAAVLKRQMFNEKLKNGYEDWDLYLSLAEQRIQGVYLDKPLLLYRKHMSEKLSVSDKIEDEVQSNKTKLSIQLRHARFVGYSRILHTFARLIRLSLGIKR